MKRIFWLMFLLAACDDQRVSRNFVGRVLAAPYVPATDGSGRVALAASGAASTGTGETMSDTMQALPKDDPRWLAWKEWRASAAYENAAQWLRNQPPNIEGELWAAFIAGWDAHMGLLPVPPAPSEAATDTVKAGMTRRMNAMFAALKAVEWADGTAIYPQCPACGGEKRLGHQDVTAHSGGRDSIIEPCPLAFALSQDAYRYGEDVAPEVTRTFEDGSRFLRRDIPVAGAAPEGPQ